MLGLMLAAATAVAGFLPASANEFHPTVVPATCNLCESNGGIASAQWVNHPNHFHLALDLQAVGCAGGCSITTTDISPQFAGGLVTSSTHHAIDTISFDYKADSCSEENGFVVIAIGSDNSLNPIFCDQFPSTGTGSFHHESFNRASFGLSAGVQIQQVFIGLINNNPTTNNAVLTNILINHAATLDIMKTPVTFCRSL
jgi:hypothetical protein